jgi:hypothetical protein
MACPFFLPEAVTDLVLVARAPLGRVYSGTCGAGAEQSTPPVTSIEHCNFGYGRGECPLFPMDAAIDAVRFTRYKGEFIYVLERECTPVEHGRASALDPASIAGRQAALFAANTPA